MAEDTGTIIKDLALTLLEKLGFSADVSVEEREGEYFCRILVNEGQHFLIGQYGVNLAALQHLLRALTRKRLDERIALSVDVNAYFAEKRSALEEEADRAAEAARAGSVSVALRPMLAYERKIVHTRLASRPDVVTESVGKGDERKILVRPAVSEE